MYSTPILSFLILVFIRTVSASVLYPVSDQLPLIARIGQPYSWSILPDTFGDDGNISASGLPSWLSFSNITFSGTPAANDEGSVDITLTAGGAQDSFALCVTHFPPPTVHIPISTQFNTSNPSMSSVFFISQSSALKDDNPAVRVPLHWSFSIGFEGGTFINTDDLFYYAQLANGSALPDWLVFNSKSVTLDGVARGPPLDEGQRVELALIGSDQAGFSAVRAPFDLIIASHDLASTGALVLNVTESEDFELNLKQNDWVFASVTLDNTTIHADSITSVSVDTSAATWLSYDSSSLTLHGTAPSKGYSALPLVLTAFNQSLPLNASIALLPPYFTTSTLPGTLANPGSEFTLELAQYISTDPAFSGHNVSLSANTSASVLNLTTRDDGSSFLAGTVPSDPGMSHIDVELTAFDHTTHAVSHAAVRISLRTPKADATRNDVLAQHRRLILGLGIGLGGATGLIIIAGLLAIIRKFCHVKDTAAGPYSRNGKGERGIDVEKEGYGWTDKAGLDLSEIPTAYRTPHLGLGVGYTPSLVPGSPPAKMTTKAAFFGGINLKAAVRKFSGSGARKSAISKPVLLITKESTDSLSALRAAAGLDDAPGSRHYLNSGSDSVNIPEGDGLSIGRGSGLGSSPTSSTGHSNETTKRSKPHQRVDFGPPRIGATLGVAPLPPTPRENAYSTPNAKASQRVRRYSATSDERELEEAVIGTASRATSLRSGHSSFAASTYTRDSIGANSAAATRPRLVQFTSVRGVPMPVPTQTSLAGPSGPRERRRVSQIAAVVSPITNSNNEADADAIMTEGMRYVRAFGDQNKVLEQPNLGRQSPAPSRSNSKRSSRSRGCGLSPATTTASGSPGQTTSSYAYPSPLQSGDLNVNAHGRSLMMSHILVCVGEAFTFKYPVVLSSPSSSASSSSVHDEKKLIVRPLQSGVGAHLPAFLAHAVGAPTLTSSLSSIKQRMRYEVQFWGTPGVQDVGVVVVGVFTDDGGEEECVGRLTVSVTARARE
ncbi:hypothetical protein DFH11DRAFT_1234178 [Phellopilus nigrolimitatus]|nr:hypothetical protein DFH11DRAFT_1234178 [Phellopilus nigrolimitatus]